MISSKYPCDKCGIRSFDTKKGLLTHESELLLFILIAQIFVIEEEQNNLIANEQQEEQ